MNSLDGTVLSIQEPTWLPEYSQWEVAFAYDCWGQIGESCRWYPDKEAALAGLVVGQTVLV